MTSPIFNCAIGFHVAVDEQSLKIERNDDFLGALHSDDIRTFIIRARSYAARTLD